MSLGFLSFVYPDRSLPVDSALWPGWHPELPGRSLSEAEEAALEAVSQKKGDKWTYKGKTGVWRTAASGEKIFIPDDGSGIMGVGGAEDSGDPKGGKKFARTVKKEEIAEAAKGKAGWQDKRTAWSRKERKADKKSTRVAGKKETERQMRGEDLVALDDLDRLLDPFGLPAGPAAVLPIVHPCVLGAVREDQQVLAREVAQEVLGEEFPGKPRAHDPGLWTRLHKELAKKKGVDDPKALAGWIKSQLLKAGHTIKEPKGKKEEREEARPALVEVDQKTLVKEAENNVKLLKGSKRETRAKTYLESLRKALAQGDEKAAGRWFARQEKEVAAFYREQKGAQAESNLAAELDALLSPFLAQPLDEQRQDLFPLTIKLEDDVLYVLKAHVPVVVFNNWSAQETREHRRMLRNALTNQTGVEAPEQLAQAILRKLDRGSAVAVGVSKGSYVISKAKGSEKRQKKTAASGLKRLARVATRTLGPQRRAKAGGLDESANVAQTIIDQLGGWGRIKAMTGAKHVVKTHGGHGVRFRFINKKSSRGNEVEIVHDAGKDLYDVEFFASKLLDSKSVKKYRGLGAEQLKPTFERQTGLRLSL